jgi:hypothetical protein
MNPTKTGLVLAAVLSLGDVATPVLSDGEHPPMSIALLAAALGLATLAALVPAWRGSPAARWAVIATRVVSMLGAVPAFFVSDVPAGAVAGAGIGVVLTLLCVALIAPGLRARPARTA